MDQKKRDNLEKALISLEMSLKEPIVNQRDIAGIIQNFEFVYELSWNFLKAYLRDQGVETGPPKDVFTKAYQLQLIDDEQIWIEILKARNLTTHTYDNELAKRLVKEIQDRFFKVFLTLKKLF